MWMAGWGLWWGCLWGAGCTAGRKPHVRPGWWGGDGQRAAARPPRNALKAGARAGAARDPGMVGGWGVGLVLAGWLGWRWGRRRKRPGGATGERHVDQGWPLASVGVVWWGVVGCKGARAGGCVASYRAATQRGAGVAGKKRQGVPAVREARVNMTRSVAVLRQEGAPERGFGDSTMGVGRRGGGPRFTEGAAPAAAGSGLGG